MQGFPASLGRVFTLIAGHFPKWNQLLFELVAAIVLAPIVLWVYRRYEPRLLGLATSFYKLSDRPLACLLVVGLLPILLRLALLPWYPVPVPRVADEFGHLLVADTLLQGRLANPEHPLRQHLATMYVLQSPTYASIYPIGQGALLALGRILTGVPWAGVCLH